MLALLYALYKTESVVHLHEEKNGKEAPIWGVAQFWEMNHPGS